MTVTDKLLEDQALKSPRTLHHPHTFLCENIIDSGRECVSPWEMQTFAVSSSFTFENFLDSKARKSRELMI